MAKITVTGVQLSPFAAPGETREVEDTPLVRRFVKQGVLSATEATDPEGEAGPAPEDTPPANEEAPEGGGDDESPAPVTGDEADHWTGDE